MKRFYTKTKSNFEKDIFRFKESKYDFLRFHLGTNSIGLTLAIAICIAVAFEVDVLNWKYLKGVDEDLSFFIGLFSMILGVGFYKFWRLDEKSVYTILFAKTKFIPKGANILFTYNNFSFGICSKIKIKNTELPSVIRQLLCIGIIFNLALIILDSGEIDKLKAFPSEVLQSKSGFCPDKEESIDNAQAKEGCELIIRAYKLGYAKDLGICAPEKIDADKMKICEKRRKDEPYFHYMSRLLISSINNTIDFFDNNKAKIIADKFDLQLQELEVLKDYQRYAMSAAPRASHHIWTNLPYPENIFIQKYRELFKPSYCIEQFQNQTNTISLDNDDDRANSKLMEHVFGQLLFNPKNRISVGFCKEYNIHWDSNPNICERLSNNPKAVLQEEKVYSEVALVLKRHDIANVILNLDEEIQKLENKHLDKNTNLSNLSNKEKQFKYSKTTNSVPNKKQHNIIVKGKIAKDKQQIRKKNELVSFQCFMQENGDNKRNAVNKFRLKDTNFLIRTRYFPNIESKGGSQISMYKEFSKVLENRFHYSKLTSRSDINIEDEISDTKDDEHLLEEPSYLFSRLEILKNVDIFLGNTWVLERDDLLGIYPYHVHLQNYVKSFREEYKESHGRL